MTTATAVEDQAAVRRFASIADGALRSGLSISTLRNWVREGRLTGYQPGSGKILIDLRQLDDVILRSVKA